MSPTSEGFEESTEQDPNVVETDDLIESDRFIEQEKSHSNVTSFDHWLVRTLIRRAGSPPVQITLWDNQPVFKPSDSLYLNMRLGSRSLLLRLCLSPNLQFGEGYSQGLIQIDGDLVHFLEVAYRCFPKAGWFSRMCQRWRLWRAHSLASSRLNIHRHYDLSEDFYELWLDQQMLYTCAYFPEVELTLEDAQIAKMEHVCRKLRLKPGQTVVEAGCGWGALSLYMAREYDVRVKAYNISHEQVRYARERARREGLNDRVEFLEDDWRNITGTYDAFVSVGMLEHVGIENYPLLGNVIHRSLNPSGLGLIHSIGKTLPGPVDPWIEHRIFPGAEPPTLKQMLDIFEGHRFSVLDVENLRLHYAQTLRHWLQRYQQHEETVLELYDDSFRRAWRLYLAGSIASFSTSLLQLYQVVFAHSDNNHVPRSREFLYLSKPQTGPQSSASRGVPEENF